MLASDSTVSQCSPRADEEKAPSLRLGTTLSSGNAGASSAAYAADGRLSPYRKLLLLPRMDSTRATAVVGRGGGIHRSP
ncbi:hypothetical protein PC128_g6027 [Phytophthora cactorum]|nr:hypothetical protein PC120_g8590 [Phytophthora cactorum]KAG3198442.1 hypothetical protein PC128_g6027 [Phytophthora cactorum]KAG4056271.1 hypothetical protein PC123_g8656 [Phytophthora cactorum]